MSIKSYKYILLDWDGNLARTLDIWLAALRLSLQKRGHNFPDKQIGANFTVFQERMVSLGMKDVEAMITEADELATRQVPNVELYPDAIATLENLHKINKKLALVTTSRHDQIDDLIIKHSLSDIFDVIVCGDDVANHKPHPEPIEKALQMFGANKEDALMVGDSGSDITGAANAGVDSVLFFPSSHARFYDLDTLRKLEPTYIIEDFRELVEVVS